MGCFLARAPLRLEAACQPKDKELVGSTRCSLGRLHVGRFFFFFFFLFFSEACFQEAIVETHPYSCPFVDNDHGLQEYQRRNRTFIRPGSSAPTKPQSTVMRPRPGYFFWFRV